jgi:hypothetical protein
VPLQSPGVARRSRCPVDLSPLSPLPSPSGVIEAKTGGRGSNLAAIVEDLDAAFGGFELRVAEAGELDTTFEQLERFLERELSFFERLHDRFEFGDGRFEVFDGGIHD